MVSLVCMCKMFLFISAKTQQRIPAVNNWAINMAVGKCFVIEYVRNMQRHSDVCYIVFMFVQRLIRFKFIPRFLTYGQTSVWCSNTLLSYWINFASSALHISYIYPWKKIFAWTQLSLSNTLDNFSLIRIFWKRSVWSCGVHEKTMITPSAFSKSLLTFIMENLYVA